MSLALLVAACFTLAIIAGGALYALNRIRERIGLLANVVDKRFEEVAKQFGKWPRDPSWKATGNPSLISWGPTYREALLFVLRGAINSTGLPLANIMGYVNPNADCIRAALSPLLRDAKFDGSEADAIMATLVELRMDGTVEEEEGAFRLSKQGLAEALYHRSQIEALNKANAAKMEALKLEAAKMQQTRMPKAGD